jgi:branched-subunit amino acid aminotransferase/4-amino-4-deoxychorismate lyase
MLKEFISSRDWGAAFGYGLFETMRIYKGHPFLLEEHIERLMNSSQNLSFLKMPDREILIKLIYDYMKDKDLHDEAIRLSVTYGNEAERIAPQVFITYRKVPYGPLDYEKGIAAVISSYKKNEYSPIVQHKTFNQLENILAQRFCSELEVKECIFMNTSGYIAEGSKSNIFFIRHGKVFTPSLECGILPGITRQKIIDLLNQQPIEVIEGRYKSNEIYNCDECFCTNSLMEVMPIVKLNRKDIGNGSPGKLTKFILALYHQYLERYLTKSNIECLK